MRGDGGSRAFLLHAAPERRTRKPTEFVQSRDLHLREIRIRRPDGVDNTAPGAKKTSTLDTGIRDNYTARCGMGRGPCRNFQPYMKDGFMGVTEVPLVWLQAGGCSGCSVSLLNSDVPPIRRVLLDPILPDVHLNLKYHPTIMASQGAEAAGILRDVAAGEGHIVIVEGAIPGDGEFCSIGSADGEVSVRRQFLDLAVGAQLVVAVGTCASFGGISAAEPNPGGYRELSHVMDEEGVDVPLVRVPGCPPHPDWMTTALVEFLSAEGPEDVDLDEWNRPRSVYGQLIHENCPRRSYFDEGDFAAAPGDPECLHEVGCKGPITRADCPLREWNSGTSWCIKGGGPCQGCVEPGYPDETTPFYRELPEDALPRIGEEAEEK